MEMEKLRKRKEKTESCCNIRGQMVWYRTFIGSTNYLTANVGDRRFAPVALRVSLYSHAFFSHLLFLGRFSLVMDNPQLEGGKFGPALLVTGRRNSKTGRRLFLYITTSIGMPRSERKYGLAKNESSNGWHYSASMWRAHSEGEWRKIFCRNRQIHNVIPEREETVVN